MFKLMIALFVVSNVNGAINVTPAGQLTTKSRFENREACLNYLNTDAGKEERLAIEELMERKKLTATYSCHQDWILRERDSI